MNPEITEFSFGFAIMEEVTRRWRGLISSAPVLPNLRQESQLGYDVSLEFSGWPIFLQFKLSDFLSRANAMERKTHNAFVDGEPFHRFHIVSKSTSGQHDLLLRLEGTYPGSVFYVAPRFHLQSQLSNFYLQSVIMENSKFVKPSVIGQFSDSLTHSFSFNSSGEQHVFSSPKRIDADTSVRVLEQSISGVTERKSLLSFPDDWPVLISSMYRASASHRNGSIAQGHSLDLDRVLQRLKSSSPESAIELVAMTSRIVLNAELLLVRSAPNLPANGE